MERRKRRNEWKIIKSWYRQWKALNVIPFAFHNAKRKNSKSKQKPGEREKTQTTHTNTHIHKSIFIFFYFIRIWNRPNYFLTFKSCVFIESNSLQSKNEVYVVRLFWFSSSSISLFYRWFDDIFLLHLFYCLTFI